MVHFAHHGIFNRFVSSMRQYSSLGSNFGLILYSFLSNGGVAPHAPHARGQLYLVLTLKMPFYGFFLRGPVIFNELFPRGHVMAEGAMTVGSRTLIASMAVGEVPEPRDLIPPPRAL